MSIDQDIVNAMKAQTQLIKMHVTKSGMSRYYRAFTVINGMMVDCTHTLNSIMGKPSKAPESLYIVRGCGFSPCSDIAETLETNQSNVRLI